MKKVILTFLLLLISFLSCNDNSTDPIEDPQLSFLSLPGNAALGDTTRIDKFYMLRGSYATTIQYDRQFTGGPFGQYTISATLYIEAGTIAATDSLLCQLSVFVENTCVHIFPIEPFFAHPFKLSIKYTGIDLQNFKLSDLQFVSMNGDNQILGVTYDAASIDYVTGTLEIVNAVVKYSPQIDPDSKYGWVRKAD